jgi:hypothetical protein
MPKNFKEFAESWGVEIRWDLKTNLVTDVNHERRIRGFERGGLELDLQELRLMEFVNKGGYPFGGWKPTSPSIESRRCYPNEGREWADA